MKKIIKLTACVDGEVIYVNPHRFNYFIETGLVRNVYFGKERIVVEEPLEEVKRLIDDPHFIDFCGVANKASRLLINASQISEWHEQYDGVFLQVLNDGFVVQGTLEEVTAKIEKALEEGER